MYAGIDFGTSSCSIGVWKNNGPVLLPLEGESTRLPSALYTTRPTLPIEEVDTLELERRIAAARRRQTAEFRKAKEENGTFKELSDAELENIERGAMRRELAERAKKRYRSQTINEVLYADTEVVFGEEAILRHIQEPQNGFFIKSPKSFLGAAIQPHHAELFFEVIKRILAFIKATAEINIQNEIDNIVLGRPVNFHGTRGQEGNHQAIGILESAAMAAGFKSVEFLMEPIAAAMDFERSIPEDVIALVLDVGGGTTDCSMVKLGPSHINSRDRNNSVLGYAGDRVGGTDIDIKLALMKIMPHFGRNSLLKNGLPIPNILFWNAVAINDVNAQEQFWSDNTQHEILFYLGQAADKKKVQRILNLQKGRLTFRLNRSAELAKIHLSERDPINLPLRYIEPELVIPVSRYDLRESIERELDVFLSLMKEVENQAGVKPDILYVTGGTAKSPIVEEWIRSNYRHVEIVVGDAFGSVVSGLTTWARRIYQ
ncbi:molecular chaperone [Methylococcus capsulatus]|uniref:molecular chaperone n=1 Tax=Methylococcus capsulatus TaxID=414 RepID=UPI001C52D810|nr:molecular chaperone [Methylococcus capsulatus]QXP91518.1 molecular chaperone [Methylococcus capsulatus]